MECVVNDDRKGKEQYERKTNAPDNGAGNGTPTASQQHGHANTNERAKQNESAEDHQTEQSFKPLTCVFSELVCAPNHGEGDAEQRDVQAKFQQRETPVCLGCVFVHGSLRRLAAATSVTARAEGKLTSVAAVNEAATTPIIPHRRLEGNRNLWPSRPRTPYTDWHTASGPFSSLGLTNEPSPPN